MRVIDSHTGGEPTRILVEGGPDLGTGPMEDRRARFINDHDVVRQALILEPRGTDYLVGGVLCEPVDPDCAAGIVFFNNVGGLHMCGHGTIGLAVTLAYLGRIQEGEHRIETPVGDVAFHLHSANEVTVGNVPSYRLLRDVTIEVPELGTITGDIAWGGNWFFLSKDAPCELDAAHIRPLTDAAEAVKAALVAEGITGEDGGEIDHIEFFGPPQSSEAQSRNFVLCPGGAYDRSPCGTGTSAKLACLAADGILAPGETWVQESVIGSTFSGRYEEEENGRILPSITGTAFITGDNTLIQQDGDPFRDGIQQQ